MPTMYVYLHCVKSFVHVVSYTSNILFP
jgi:hypothetical protein